MLPAQVAQLSMKYPTYVHVGQVHLRLAVQHFIDNHCGRGKQSDHDKDKESYPVGGMCRCCNPYQTQRQQHDQDQ